MQESKSSHFSPMGGGNAVPPATGIIADFQASGARLRSDLGVAPWIIDAAALLVTLVDQNSIKKVTTRRVWI